MCIVKSVCFLHSHKQNSTLYVSYITDQQTEICTCCLYYISVIIYKGHSLWKKWIINYFAIHICGQCNFWDILGSSQLFGPSPGSEANVKDSIPCFCQSSSCVKGDLSPMLGYYFLTLQKAGVSEGGSLVQNDTAILYSKSRPQTQYNVNIWTSKNAPNRKISVSSVYLESSVSILWKCIYRFR